MKTLSEQVARVEKQAKELNDLAGEIIATLQSNFDKGEILFKEEANSQLFKCWLEGWKRRYCTAGEPAK